MAARCLAVRVENIVLKKFNLNDVSVRFSGSRTDEMIKIPNRIKRGPTDILKALVSTVGVDYTAPHYKYQDDPFFIPSSNMAKRTYALSKESGRNAAKFFLDKYPDSFKNDPAFPKIPAFNPKKKYTEESEVTKDDLIELVQAANVADSITVYKNLKKNDILVDKDLKLTLLELICYYNGKQSLYESSAEERWLRRATPQDTRNSWDNGGLAESIFNELESKDGRAYSAIICGMVKYMQADKAYSLFKEMQNNGIQPTLESVNALIGAVVYLRDGFEQRWQLILELLNIIKENGYTPNLSTFNSSLEVLSRTSSSQSKTLSLQILAEMNSLGIKPSLATYYNLLVMFYKSKGPTSAILYDIMDEVEKNTYEISDPKDVFFFVSAMDACHTKLFDLELGYRIHACLMRDNHYALIGDAFRESIYYQHFFRLLTATENIDKFFEVYRRYVPNIYTPEPSVMLDILEMVDLNDEMQYLPELWSDIIIFSHFERPNIVEKVLSLMARKKQPAELQARMDVIAADIWKRIEEMGNRQTFRTKIQWTGLMLGDLIMTAIHSENSDLAWTAVQFLDKEEHQVVGVPQMEPLRAYCEFALRAKDEARVLSCVKYALQLGYVDVRDYVKSVAEKYSLSDGFLKRLDAAMEDTVLADS